MSSTIGDRAAVTNEGNHDRGGGGEARQRKIVHVDMDSYYASVEQRDDPTLRGKAIAVGSEQQRGVVATASYEARRFGVRSAMPSITAKRLCPDLIFVKPRFDVYRQVSEQIRAIFYEYTALVEPLSLDEAYLDVTENLKGLPYATSVAREIRARILEETSLTASAGVGPNKFLAKMASDMNKPNGMYVITPDMAPSFVEGLPVAKFHGIGPKTAERMHGHGIVTGRDLKERSLEFLVREFGKAGRYYFDISRGIDDRPVQPDRIRKSIGAENTFAFDLTLIDEMKRELDPIVEKVWSHCERTGVRGRTVTLKVKFDDFRQITRSRSLPADIEGKELLRETGFELLEGIHPTERGVRLLGVSLSGLNTDAEPDNESGQLALAL